METEKPTTMQRPVMDITYLEDATAARSAAAQAMSILRLGRVMNAVRGMFGVVWRMIRAVMSALLYDPIAHTALGGRFRNDDGSPTSRFLRGLAYRLAFVPVFAALTACAMVFSATHPAVSAGDKDPSSLGIYYDAVTLLSDDGVRLEAWLVPAVDARTVLDQREKLLRTKQPAVVLLHDFADRRQQMLSLVKPLHDAGFVVLVPALRGCGTTQRVGQTFGLHEALDAKSAVELLRKRTFVDPQRIALVGVGSGATAALIAASNDASLKTLVLESPIGGLNEVINNRIVPNHRLLRWAGPLCKWAFELAYEVDGEELNVTRYQSVMNERNVLMLDRRFCNFEQVSAEQVDQIKTFLAMNAIANDRVKPIGHTGTARSD